MNEIAVADGDLTRRLPVVSQDEVGLLAGRFNAFVEKLHGVLVTVSSNIPQLETASREVSAGNSDLSACTEQQAASIQRKRSVNHTAQWICLSIETRLAW